ncbi:HAD family hydrolase [Streptomyces lasiicapitis]|uniref:Haloacid dehalogenase n=1 Tax=Streptomyces lasiicapitis TaxID=1923961 RepID=A0ABQ2LL17_9ACTN|nr:HAD family phosphatase [Streptomyces lasiicapitis]GGO39049.1 haloacid dehalogenase [Streptomyces lasiicapitis]
MSAIGCRAEHSPSQRLIILDFDGVLLDTERVAIEAWESVLDEAGVDLPDGIPAHADGTLARDSMDEALISALGQETARELWDRFERENQRRADEEPLPPAARSFLGHCLDKGHRLAVASSNSHIWVTGHLDRLGISSHFTSVTCADDTLPPKPAPDVYLAALRHDGSPRGGCPPHQALAVEDSFAGLASAHTAGVPAAWVTSQPAGTRPPVPVSHRVHALDELNSAL